MAVKEYRMLVVPRDGARVVVAVKHNELDVEILVAKAILAAGYGPDEVLHCSCWRGK